MFFTILELILIASSESYKICSIFFLLKYTNFKISGLFTFIIFSISGYFDNKLKLGLFPYISIGSANVDE